MVHVCFSDGVIICVLYRHLFLKKEFTVFKSSDFDSLFKLMKKFCIQSIKKYFLNCIVSRIKYKSLRHFLVQSKQIHLTYEFCRKF